MRGPGGERKEPLRPLRVRDREGAEQSVRKSANRPSGEPTRWNWVWNGNNINVSGRSPNVATSFNRDTTVTLTACRRPADGGPEECSTATKVVTVSS